MDFFCEMKGYVQPSIDYGRELFLRLSGHKSIYNIGGKLIDTPFSKLEEVCSIFRECITHDCSTYTPAFYLSILFLKHFNCTPDDIMLILDRFDLEVSYSDNDTFYCYLADFYDDVFDCDGNEEDFNEYSEKFKLILGLN